MEYDIGYKLYVFEVLYDDHSKLVSLEEYEFKKYQDAVTEFKKVVKKYQNPKYTRDKNKIICVNLLKYELINNTEKFKNIADWNTKTGHINYNNV